MGKHGYRAATRSLDLKFHCRSKDSSWPAAGGKAAVAISRRAMGAMGAMMQM